MALLLLRTDTAAGLCSCRCHVISDVLLVRAMLVVVVIVADAPECSAYSVAVHFTVRWYQHTYGPVHGQESLRSTAWKAHVVERYEHGTA